MNACVCASDNFASIWIMWFIFGNKKRKTNSKLSRRITYNSFLIKTSRLLYFFIKMTKNTRWHCITHISFSDVSHTTVRHLSLASFLPLFLFPYPPIPKPCSLYASPILHHSPRCSTTTAMSAEENQRVSERTILLKSWPVEEPVVCLGLIKPPVSSICSVNP